VCKVGVEGVSNLPFLRPAAHCDFRILCGSIPLEAPKPMPQGTCSVPQNGPPAQLSNSVNANGSNSAALRDAPKNDILASEIPRSGPSGYSQSRRGCQRQKAPGQNFIGAGDQTERDPETCSSVGAKHAAQKFRALAVSSPCPVKDPEKLTGKLGWNGGR